MKKFGLIVAVLLIAVFTMGFVAVSASDDVADFVSEAMLGIYVLLFVA